MTDMLDYGAVAERANEIKGIASEMRETVLNRIRDVIQKAEYNWHGEAADNFGWKSKIIADNIEIEYKNLAKISAGLENMAAEIKLAAEIAAALANQNNN